MQINENHILKPCSISRKLERDLDKGIRAMCKRRGLNYEEMFGGYVGRHKRRQDAQLFSV